MRLPLPARGESGGFNMTPMIDVVFLLIIFFLVSSQLARQEVAIDLKLPEAASGQRPVDQSVAPVTVNVLPDGSVLLSGAKVLPQQLQHRLQVEAEQSEKSLEVRIRGDRSVPYRHVEPIMLACARAGIWNVHFSVLKQTPPEP